MDLWHSKNSLIRVIRFSILIFSIILAIFSVYTWKVLSFDKLNVPDTGIEIVISPGTSLRQFSKQLKSIGVLDNPYLIRLYVLYKGNTKHIKAGEYRIYPGTSAISLLEKVYAGKVAQYSFTIIEGWQSKNLIEQLQQHPKIISTLINLSDKEIIQRLNIAESNLEGIFLPDTYNFTANTKDVDFLRRAYFSMREKLQAAWQKKSTNTALKTPYDALILASIIEKETSIKEEYAKIAGVFTRRLIKKMRLQADPTVIYALRDKLEGPLLRKHLTIDSPYNTYVKTGLPPTPIALPSIKAIEAAINPDTSNSLYFVATGLGDGAHIFSDTLSEHNKAVNNLYSNR